MKSSDPLANLGLPYDILQLQRNGGERLTAGTVKKRALLLAVGCLLLSQAVRFGPVQAAVSKTEAISAGQTTYDGALTLTVALETSGNADVSVRNNDRRPVFIDSYAQAYGSAYVCAGTYLRLRSDETRHLCTLNMPSSNAGWYSRNVGKASPVAADSPIPDFVKPSFRLMISWHK